MRFSASFHAGQAGETPASSPAESVPIICMLFYTNCDLGDGLRQADLMISSGVKVWAKVTSVTSGMSFLRSMVA